MNFNDDTSLYDVLDLKPDASPQEVREAYLRTKAAYNKDSVALYTLIGSDEREEMLHRIERAYETLSSADRRKEYDRNHGLLDFDAEYSSPSRVPHSKKIISIDRVPPMEHASHATESMLVPPSTDFTSGSRAGATSHADAAPAAGASPLGSLAASDPSGGLFDAEPAMPAAPAATPAPSASIAASSDPARTAPAPRNLESALAHEIAQETEWRGGFLNRIRESRRISIEEMSNITKVTKGYLLAIEEENFPKLPAPVFMRGFVTQLAKVLKLPHEQVAAAYMARYHQARPDKTAQ